MKKITATIIFIISILLLINTVSATQLQTILNSNKVEIDEQIEFTINFNEKIQTADFSVYFDNEKITYIGSSTEDLKTNYRQQNKEIICCYYDLNKIGTDKITLKFKATTETSKTNIKINNITVHTDSEEKQLENITSENIKIVNKNTNTNTNQQIDISKKYNNLNNSTIDSTESVQPLPKAGIDFKLRDMLIIAIAILILILILKNEQLSKPIKAILAILTILIGIIIFFNKYISSAISEDKIFINKEEKTILVVLSTANKQRTMTIQEFKNITKATTIENNTLSGALVTFKNNEKYSVKIFRDENNNEYVNSGDIFELLNKDKIDTEAILELSNFIIKKGEFNIYNNIPYGYEEFNENSISTPSEPSKDNYISVKNIDELKKANAKIGDKYQTLGYYKENDGGTGKYNIIEKNENIKIDNGLYVELNNGLIAKLEIVNETVNVKQFGAKGDALNDDTQYLRIAFNCGIANIELPKGEYKITDKIALDTPSTNIIGNNNTIFTNNDYKPEKYSEFLFIMQSNNCNINNLKIEARETKKIENLYKAQVYVGATNIKIKGCSFNIPETASSEQSYSNIDLYTGWHDVIIENCDLYLANDAKEGGCIWIRDLFNRGASNLTFTNNRCYKKCHDEILAVFMGNIENVNILNNTFTMPNSTDPSVMCFTFGSGTSIKAENIRFEGNTIDTKATMSLIHSRNAKNLSIKNNKIKFERVTELTNTFLMYFPKDNANNKSDNNSKDITIENNEIEINNNTKKSLNGLITSNAQNIVFNNNKLTINSEVSEAFSGEFNSISNNNMLFNKTIKILANKPKKFTDNHVIFNKGFGAIAQYYIGNLNYDSNIKNNIFKNNYDEIGNNENSVLLMFNGGTLNNHLVNFEDNTVISEKANYKKNLIYILNLTDKESQTIKIINNKVDGYKQGWKDKKQEIHNIIIENQ